MNIQVEPRGPGRALITLNGNLVREHAGQVKERVRQAVAANMSRVVIDLDQVSSADSSGIVALVGGLKAAREAGGDLRIARPDVHIRKLLNESMLDQVFRCHGSLEEAFARFA